MVQELKAGKRKKLIGLTGTFGSGKSTVAKMFEALGAAVIDADLLAHEALEIKSPVFQKITALFPESFLTISGALDRKKIGAMVFKDAAKRKALEAIVHPYVFERIHEEAERSSSPLVMVEVPLLFESGFEKFCDKVICVSTSEKVARERLGAKGFSAEEISARLSAQFFSEEKKKRSHYAIENSENLERTKQNVLEIWKQLKSNKGD